jgi:hypothetical protein
MGARPKSTADLERKGAFDKNPARGRDRAAEPQPKGDLGPPPEEWKYSADSLKLNAAWKELLRETEGFLITAAHRGLFVATCQLRVRCNRSTARTGDFAQYAGYLDRLGLGGDGSRSKVIGNGVKTTEQEEDEWQQAADGGTGLSVQ